MRANLRPEVSRLLPAVSSKPDVAAAEETGTVPAAGTVPKHDEALCRELLAE